MTTGARLLDAIVPIVRTRLPSGVDVAYLEVLLGRHSRALERVIEQDLGPLPRKRAPAVCAAKASTCGGQNLSAAARAAARAR